MALSSTLATLPPGPIATESYTWWAKLQIYRTQTLLTVPTVQDPTFVTAARARELRVMDPLPDPMSAQGGYVVEGPVHERRGWPSNWDTYRTNMRTLIPPTTQLELVAEVGRARIWRWRAP